MTDIDGLTLPLDYAAIERILPHRYPFLLVDRITEFEPDRRIVGVKNVSLQRAVPRAPARRAAGAAADDPDRGDRAGWRDHDPGEAGEPSESAIFFMGIERVRYRQPVHPGDVVEIEATVLRLRSRMGRLKGIARVEGQVVVEGIMTFALGPRGSESQDLQRQ